MSIEKTRIGDFSSANAWQSGVVIYFYLTLIGLAISSYICLDMFLVRFGAAGSYVEIKDEVEGTAELIRTRSVKLEWAVWISEVCLVSAITVTVAAEVLRAFSVV